MLAFERLSSRGTDCAELLPKTLIVAGWTGRDEKALHHHIEELAAIGEVAPIVSKTRKTPASQFCIIELLLGERRSGRHLPSTVYDFCKLRDDFLERQFESHDRRKRHQGGDCQPNHLDAFDQTLRLVSGGDDGVEIGHRGEIRRPQHIVVAAGLADQPPVFELVELAGVGRRDKEVGSRPRTTSPPGKRSVRHRCRAFAYLLREKSERPGHSRDQQRWLGIPEIDPEAAPIARICDVSLGCRRIGKSRAVGGRHSCRLPIWHRRLCGAYQMVIGPEVGPSWRS